MMRRLPHRTPSARWENICLRCGICCHEKEVGPTTVCFDLRSPCEHFDNSTGLCRIYPTRFETCRFCRPVTLLTAMFSPSLPPECGYVRWARRRMVRFAGKREVVYLTTCGTSHQLDA